MNKSFLYLSVLLASGCGTLIKSEYIPPAITYPAHWKQAEADAAGETAIFDWHSFAGQQLEQWLTLVEAKNSSVALAILQVYQAELRAEQAGLALAPSFSVSASTGLTADKALSGSYDRSRNDDARAMARVSYEADLWGKLARQQDVAEWQRQASEEDLASARLILLRRAAENYWTLALLGQQIEVSKLSLDYTKEILRQTQVRYRSGSISGLDVISAQQSVLSQENALRTLHQLRQQALNEQSVLLGAPPGQTVVIPSRLSDTPLPQVRPDIPVSVLSRRPDIRSAELGLRSALAEVDIRRADYYPSFSLTGNLGGSSHQLLEFLRNPLASLSAVLTLSPLDFRKKDLDIRLARNNYEQQTVKFRQELYNAMASLDNALTRRQLLITEEVHLRETLELAKKSEQINAVRYRNGAVMITDWLSAQENRRRAELNIAQNRYNQLSTMMVIWLETGGDPANKTINKLTSTPDN
ncbi:TolC family protein [Morganella morganii]|uniref:TolC family protein n=1 Tax=Morganella morganii TaxID=582 RepID=UPI0020239347|nr:TolC family protein [Morganella morganii]